MGKVTKLENFNIEYFKGMTFAAFEKYCKENKLKSDKPLSFWYEKLTGKKVKKDGDKT